MNNKDLLNAIGEADDRFIEEAAPEERKAVKFGKAKKDPAAIGVIDRSAKVRKTSWKQWVGGIAAVLAVCVLGAATIPHLFGGAAKKADMTESIMPGNSGYYYASDMDANYNKPEAERPYDGKVDLMTNESSKSDSSGSLISSSVEKLNKDNLKLIYTANMTLQTSDYNEAEKTLSALVEQHKGYFESVKVNDSSMYASGSYKHGSYTVRIPAESYEAFINSVGNTCHVASLSQSVKDVGESYFELEGRLETLYTKQERLQELLKQAGSMSDIIELENALAETEYQIDSYKGQLNHYDSLIGYSTVYIELQTVENPSSVTQSTSFGARIARAFKNGLTYAANNFEDFILWIVSNVIGIIIFALIVFLLIRFRPITKLWRKIRKKA